MGNKTWRIYQGFSKLAFAPGSMSEPALAGEFCRRRV